MERYNRLENLEWNTSSENQLHAYKNGLKISLKGIKHHMCKLNEKEILEIRSKYIPIKYSQYKLAEEYNISQSVINDIINLKKWNHI